MKRRDLLKTLGAIGIGSTFSFGKVKKATGAMRQATACWLTPSLTEGPYYFNASLFRQDIRTDNDTGEMHDGLQLNMTFTVIDAECNPIPNVMVDIWHCDKDGLYSGYVQPAGNTAGEDFMRGIQMTDDNGQCSFITTYPGWYQGRATHIHFKVRLDSFTYVTSQFAFPESVNDAVYATSQYSGRGANPTKNSTDGIFRSDEPEYLIIDVTPNTTTGGYDGTFTIGIDAPTTGVEEKEANPDGFSLSQNYPNPFNPSTSIRYELPADSDVDLRVYDVLGKEVAFLVKGKQTAGNHEVRFDGGQLSSGFYFYRIVAGDFMQTKEMLLIK